MGKTELHQKMQKIEGLLQQAEAIPDEAVRSRVIELIQSLMELHGAGLDRMMEIAFEAGDGGLKIIDRFGSDPVISSLLLLYGLHPVEFDARVLQGLESVRPYLQSHGGDVELLGIREGVVRVRLRGSCRSCSSSADTLKLVVEQAIYEAAPDVYAIEVDETQPASDSAFVRLESLVDEKLKIIQ